MRIGDANGRIGLPHSRRSPRDGPIVAEPCRSAQGEQRRTQFWLPGGVRILNAGSGHGGRFGGKIEPLQTRVTDDPASLAQLAAV